MGFCFKVFCISEFVRIFMNKLIRVMTTKLTLTIEGEVINSAKKYAQQKGKSLSQIVENYLKSISKKDNKKENISPKVLKLMGVIKLPKDFNYKEQIGNAIAQKNKK